MRGGISIVSTGSVGFQRPPSRANTSSSIDIESICSTKSGVATRRPHDLGRDPVVDRDVPQEVLDHALALVLRQRLRGLSHAHADRSRPTRMLLQEVGT